MIPTGKICNKRKLIIYIVITKRGLIASIIQ